MAKKDTNLAIVSTESPNVDNPGDKPGLVPQKHGGSIWQGPAKNPKAGPGRPPDAWKAACRELASNDEMLQLAREVLGDKEHPAWIGAWKFVAEHAYGKPVETKDVTKRQHLTIRIVREGE